MASGCCGLSPPSSPLFFCCLPRHLSVNLISDRIRFSTSMLALFSQPQAFSAPTVHVAQQAAVRSSPVQMMEMPSRRAALLSAAALVVPFAANAKPEDYVRIHHPPPPPPRLLLPLLPLPPPPLLPHLPPRPFLLLLLLPEPLLQLLPASSVALFCHHFSKLVCRLCCCQVGGYTTKDYLKAYGKTKEAPAGDPNSPLIKFKLGDPPVTAPKKAEPAKEEPKKE